MHYKLLLTIANVFTQIQDGFFLPFNMGVKPLIFDSSTRRQGPGSCCASGLNPGFRLELQLLSAPLLPLLFFLSYCSHFPMPALHSLTTSHPSFSLSPTASASPPFSPPLPHLLLFHWLCCSLGHGAHVC